MRTVRRLPEFNCVVYDRRGYSQSRGVGPIATDVDTHADDLLSVVDGRRVSLIGHSLGGLVVLEAAERDPAAIRSIGVYEPPLPWFEWWPQRSRAFARENPADFAQSFFERLVGPGSWDRLSTQAKAERRADGPALVAELSGIRDPQAEVDLADIEVPTFAGRGSRSLEHHRHAAQVVAEMVPGARLVEFDGAAHGAHLANPDAFTRFVRSVVESGTD
jgi:pimeloyl-ACP methyl ester carboxylesterase